MYIDSQWTKKLNMGRGGKAVFINNNTLRSVKCRDIIHTERDLTIEHNNALGVVIYIVRLEQNFQCLVVILLKEFAVCLDLSS